MAELQTELYFILNIPNLDTYPKTIVTTTKDQVDIKILNSAEEDVDGNRILNLKTLKKFIEDSAGSSNKSRVRLANYFRNVYDNIYDYYVAGKSEDEEVKKKKGVTESTTAEYLTEQIKKDRYNKASNEASLSFTEKFKPKTSFSHQFQCLCPFFIVYKI